MLQTLTCIHRLSAAAGFSLAMMTSFASAQDVAQDRITLMISADRPQHYSTIGAPIQTVSIVRLVSKADLDLRSGAGARALRIRVRNAARDACEAIDDVAPIGDQDSVNCYQTALQGGMVRAEAAIQEAQVAKN